MRLWFISAFLLAFTGCHILNKSIQAQYTWPNDITGTDDVSDIVLFSNLFSAINERYLVANGDTPLTIDVAIVLGPTGIIADAVITNTYTNISGATTVVVNDVTTNFIDGFVTNSYPISQANMNLYIDTNNTGPIRFVTLQMWNALRTQMTSLAESEDWVAWWLGTNTGDDYYFNQFFLHEGSNLVASNAPRIRRVADVMNGIGIGIVTNLSTNVFGEITSETTTESGTTIGRFSLQPETSNRWVLSQSRHTPGQNHPFLSAYGFIFRTSTNWDVSEIEELTPIRTPVDSDPQPINYFATNLPYLRYYPAGTNAFSSFDVQIIGQVHLFTNVTESDDIKTGAVMTQNVSLTSAAGVQLTSYWQNIELLVGKTSPPNDGDTLQVAYEGNYIVYEASKIPVSHYPNTAEFNEWKDFINAFRYTTSVVVHVSNTVQWGATLLGWSGSTLSGMNAVEALWSNITPVVESDPEKIDYSYNVQPGPVFTSFDIKRHKYKLEVTGMATSFTKQISWYLSARPSGTTSNFIYELDGDGTFGSNRSQYVTNTLVAAGSNFYHIILGDTNLPPRPPVRDHNGTDYDKGYSYGSTNNVVGQWGIIDWMKGTSSFKFFDNGLF